MAHQPGWVDLYDFLENGDKPDPRLVAQCKASRTGIGETMLHWYAIEGTPDVLEKLIALGFDVNVQNEFGNTPLMESAQLKRWEIVRVLLAHGADPAIRNNSGNDFLAHLDEYGVDVPEWLKKDFAP